jgi:internalin A
MTSLLTLDLDTNLIDDIAPLANHPSVTTLILNNNYISDLTPLANVGTLRDLRLTNNGLTSDDMSGFANVTVNLTDLMLIHNGISDLSVLSRFTLLDSLYLSECPIGDSATPLAPLAGLTQLQTLGLSACELLSDDLGPLVSLQALTKLYLDQNYIVELNVLTNLTNLATLLIDQNNVQDLQPLVDNTNLGSGDIVDVRCNPLTSPSVTTQIATLESRGVTVIQGDDCDGEPGCFGAWIHRSPRDTFRYALGDVMTFALVVMLMSLLRKRRTFSPVHMHTRP